MKYRSVYHLSAYLMMAEQTNSKSVSQLASRQKE